MPLRKRYVFVCINRRPDDNPKGSCAARGSEAVHAAIKNELKKRGLAMHEARACTSSCLDVCAKGVTVLIEPDHVFLGGVTVGDAAAIADGIVSGVLPAHLVLSKADVDAG